MNIFSATERKFPFNKKRPPSAGKKFPVKKNNPPFEISLKIFEKPPFNISIPDDSIIYIKNPLERKLTKVLLRLDINQIKFIANDFKITYPQNIGKRDLIRILSKGIDIQDLKQQHKEETEATRRQKILKKFKQNKKKGIIIHNADEVISINKKYDNDSRRIFIYGHVDVEYQKHKFKCDFMIVNIQKKAAKEIFGKGNVSVKSTNLFMIAEKFYYYPPKQKGVFYKPKTYLKPFYVKSKKIKIASTDLLILHDMLASTCDLDHSHYHISASRTFIYNEDKYVFLNVTFKIGQAPFLWLPVYVHSLHGTSIRTALVFERGLSWYIQNTYYLKPTANYEFKFKFDWYQKLGIYMGTEIKTPYGTLKTAGAYDRHLKYIDIDNYSNYFEEVAGQGPVSGRSLRGNIDLSLSYDIVKFFSKTMPFTLNTKFNYNDMTDPYFKTQFEGKRYEVTDYLKILRSDFSNSSLAPSKSSSSSGTGRNIDYELAFKFKQTSISFSGDWNYQKSKTGNEKNAENPYNTEYWENYKQSIVFPKLSISSSIELFDLYYLTGVSKVKASTQTTTKKPEDELLKKQDGWTFSWLWNLTPSITYTRTKYYTVENGTASITSDIITKTLGFTLSAPQTIKYIYKEISLDWSIPFSATLNTNEQITQNPDESQKESDRQNSVNNYNISTGITFTFNFLTSYEYITGKLSAGITYAQSAKFGEPIHTNAESNLSKIMSYNLELEWLKTSVKLSFSYNYSPDIESRKGTLSVTTSTKIIPFVTITDVYTYDRDIGKSLNNNMTIQLSGLENVRIFKTFHLVKAYINLSWYKDFRNFKTNYMNWTYGFDFGISDSTTISLTVTGSNKKLVAYLDDEKAQLAGLEGSRSWFIDLLKSFNMFNTDHRKQSLFKINSMSLHVVHVLHKWKMEFKFNFEASTLPDGSITFVPSIYFVVSLTDLPGMNAPPIQNKYSEYSTSTSTTTSQ